jgi:hypothetical protein
MVDTFVLMKILFANIDRREYEYTVSDTDTVYIICVLCKNGNVDN